MCGRTSCNLGPEECERAASYFNQNSGKYEKPKWREVPNGGLEYRPSPNVAPSDVTPILISGDHLKEWPSKYALQPMMWGLIPHWHKGEYKTHGLSTNNCRLEHMLSSRLYSPPLKEGKRCVIICEGFYEWQTTKGKGKKQPYFIYAPQEDGVKVEDAVCWADGAWDDSKGWQGPRLLYMAGIYNAWQQDEDSTIYSYSIITMEANNTVSWIHHRMPAILETWEEIEKWLNFKDVPYSQAVKILKPATSLSSHPVSNYVNNAQHKETTCSQRVSLEKSFGSKMMQNWLQKGSIKKEPKEEGDGGSCPNSTVDREPIKTEPADFTEIKPKKIKLENH